MKNRRVGSLQFIMLSLFLVIGVVPAFLFLSINLYAYEQLLKAESITSWQLTPSFFNQQISLVDSGLGLRSQLLIFFAIYLILLIVAVYYFSRKLSSPLKQLEAQARQMSAGQWGSVIEIKSDQAWAYREIASLVTSLESMRKKTVDSYQELEAQVAERTWDLQTKLHLLTKAEEKISHVNSKLAEALAQNERQRVVLQDVLDNIPVGAIITRGANTQPEFINKRAQTLLCDSGAGASYSQRYQLFLEDHQTVYPSDQLPINQSFSNRKGGYQENIFARQPDGSFIQLYAQSSVIYSKVGQVEMSIMVFDDITERKQLERQKSEFVSVASHQLRTPLSAIKWFAELLLDTTSGKLSAKQKDYAEEVLHSSQRLISLVNDLLNVSRIESGRVAIQLKLTGICELLKAVRQRLTPIWQAKNQSLVVTCPETISSILLDPDFMGEALDNIVSNAVKYSPAESTITLAAEENKAEVIITISDQGYGIPLKQQSLVFTKFFRADNVVRKETEGTGLGLYVAQQIILASGGRLWFESSESKGTTFYLALPRRGTTTQRKGKSLIS